MHQYAETQTLDRAIAYQVVNGHVHEVVWNFK